MHPFISKYFLYLPIQFARRENVLKHVRELERTQWLTSEELTQWQWQQLKKLLKHAAMNVPYYREQFDAVNLTAESISNYQDFIKLPLLTKEQYRNNLYRFVAQHPKAKLDMKRTSGSSGIPLDIIKDRDSLARNRAIMYRCYRWYGINIGDKQARVLGHPTTFFSKLKEDLQDIVANKFRLDPVFLTEKNMLSYYRKLSRVKPKYIYGYPSAIDEFGRFLAKRSLDVSALGHPVIITTGEILSPLQKKNIETVFQSKVVNEYGCSECGIIAFTCPEGKMHLSTDNLFIEIIKDGRPAEPGETGEVVITELFNFSAPLIRYKVGDLAKVSSAKECSCGRSFPMIDAVEGRSSQLITLSSGQKVHSEIFHYISDAMSENGGGIKHFRVIQKDMLQFSIEIVPDEKFSDKTVEYLTSEFKRFLGKEIHVEIKTVAEISRDQSGKLRYFVSQMNNS